MTVHKFDPRRRRRRARRVPGGRGWRPRGRIAMLRPFAMLGVLILLWVTTDPALVEPIGLMATAPERVDERFTRCGRGRAHACVIDGDTFKLGDRKIRII